MTVGAGAATMRPAGRSPAGQGDAMQRHVLACLAAAAFVLAGCAHRPDSGELLQQAERATGADGIKTLRYVANGSGRTFGQAWQPGIDWPRIRIPAYARWL